MSESRILRISVPKSIGIDEHEARLLLAIELYREGRLTLKQAADLASMCVEDFMRELSRRGVCILNLDEEELREELEIAERIARKKHN